MQVDDRKENGFVMVRRNLMGHVDRREMSLADFGVFCVLLLEADYKTETWWGSAPALAAKFPDTPLKTIQGILLRLKRRGYIEYETTRGQRGNFSIFIPKFHPEEAEKQDPLPVLPQALPSRSSGTGKVTLTQSAGPAQALEGKQNEAVAAESEDGVRHDSISGPGWNRTSFLTHSDLVRPIQEAQEEQDEQEAALLLPSNAGTPSPAPLSVAKQSVRGVGAAPQRQQAKFQPARTVSPEDYLPARAKKGLPAPKPSASVRREQQRPVSSGPWDAIDFVFELDRNSTWNDIPVQELRRVVWFHLRGKPGYWNTEEGDLTSEERLLQAISEMQRQTPKEVTLPAYTTESIRLPDAACELCKGKGFTERPHPDYPAAMRVKQGIDCTCLVADPKPWRRIYPDAIAACASYDKKKRHNRAPAA
jgi:hypothetical protein